MTRPEVVVHVALDDCVSSGIRGQADLARGREVSICPDERECLIPRGIQVGVDWVEAEEIHSGEILDYISARTDPGIEGRKAGTREQK
jgi:hypothetical protein